MTRTVFVIAMEGEGATGCYWYDTAQSREEDSGKTGAEYEVHFEMRVDGVETDSVTEEVDEACWECVWRDGRPYRVVLPAIDEARETLRKLGATS